MRRRWYGMASDVRLGVDLGIEGRGKCRRLPGRLWSWASPTIELGPGRPGHLGWRTRTMSFEACKPTVQVALVGGEATQWDA